GAVTPLPVDSSAIPNDHLQYAVTWFARDIDQMADLLGTEPLLVVARNLSQPGGAVTPLPVDSSAIPNDHLQYAVTWFGLAAIWTVMMLYFVYRLRNPAKGQA
ncbi:MAG: SURF1 family cytochrome oxidase biogenesis protein, partial [Pseudomonadota bacterium]